NHWNDIANSDRILAIGSNAAENHPASFGHITVAKQRGAKLISVDPRFTRTSAKADIYAPLRSGTDIAFISGMVKYVLDDIDKNPGNYNMTYITEYTNASFLVNPDYLGPAELDGLFSGYAGGNNETDGTKKKYNKATWAYQLDENGVPLRDKTLTDPNCVFQIMKKHFSRYTPDKVSNITGCPQAKLFEVYKTYAASGMTGKAGTILYAMGTTQHTYGAQNIRSYTILQLLLANIGIAGGGINAMRGESNVQGSTDYALLFHILPGYLKVSQDTDTDLATYLERTTPRSNDPLSLNWWKNTPNYMVSLLKAWYGDAATRENDFGFHYLPKIESGQNYSHIALFEAMDAGKIKGFMVWGQNPAVGGPNANLERRAMEKLDWMVAADIWPTETANFWQRPGADPSKIKTEVFLLPALASFEKEGSVTNSGRWMQWRYKGANGPSGAREDLWMMNQITLKLKELYLAEGGPSAESITNLTWDYGDEHPDVRQVAKEVNGYDLTTGKLLDSFSGLKDDGTTTSGNWLYCNSYVEPEKEPDAPIPGNRASLRDLTPDAFDVGLTPKWAWCWPVNRRIIYNRASVDLNGKPWDAEHPVIAWQDGKWVGDIPDGGGAPMAEGGYFPFIMRPEGLGCMYGPGMADGPLPEHYEPWESPVTNIMSGQQNDPAFKVWRADERGTPDKYPIVCSTYRVCEHWQGGQMTRNLPWLVEMMPEPFVEMSEELATEKGVQNGEKVIVETTRGQVNMVAVVTPRFKPFQIDGKVVHQIGIPWHWGYIGLSTGDSANVLTPHVGDANTMIPEYKAFLCNVRKA
ncbi:MAG: formate dehydrogenase-N subunit alpha, partial [Chloroflexota bacterium]